MTKIVLTGFMGTGKTAVGREVARLLDLSFTDMDEEIEARAGKSISQVFAEDGEDKFRRMETLLCQELSARQDLVISTGGGALVDTANRALMSKDATVACLRCSTDELLRRLGEGESSEGIDERPLLHAADPRAEIERLLAQRLDAYRAIPWQLDTTDYSIEEVAVQIARLVGVLTLPVRHPGGEYPIHIGRGLLSRIGQALPAAGVIEGGCVAVVSNPVVAQLYYKPVEESLRSAGYRPFVCSIPEGEQHKTLATVSALYDQFLSGGLDRSGVVLSLGGGVTGDLAGFAAASFMRGVRFVQVPTTLLAMVDASVGGKTGVDLPQGKNLVGAFKQPALVMIDPSVLVTLPAEEMRSGVAEVIKHGVIDSPHLFEELSRGDGDLSSWWGEGGADRVASALRVKVDVVEHDPFEQGRRAVLNLGHTVGHALEQLSGFVLRHGEAIGIGLVAAARIAIEMDRADPLLSKRVEAALAAWRLPVRCPPFSANAIWEAMGHDKKRQGHGLRWVLPHAVGEVEVADDVPRDIVMSVLRTLGAGRETRSESL